MASGAGWPAGIAEQMDLIRLGFAYAIRHELDLLRMDSFGTRGGGNYDTAVWTKNGLMAETARIYFQSRMSSPSRTAPSRRS